MSAFVSHDGDGTEVYVTTATAAVTDIDERERSANVKLEASYLQHPLNAWISTGEEALNILRKAKENGEEVEIRIEAQRKPKVDKSIPIQEIRDSKNAKTDIIKKVASVNGVFTSEALTNPDDDPDTGRAKSALNRPAGSAAGKPSAPAGAGKDAILGLLRNLATTRDVAESVVDALKAQALIAGASVHEITEASTVEKAAAAPQQSASFSREAPSYKDFNSDGRLNLGNYTVAAGVGVYNYVFEKLSKTLEMEPKPRTTEYFSALVLAMADVIQVGAYGQGFRADRSVGSHTRVRASLFTVIDFNPFPVTSHGEIDSPEKVSAWVKAVGADARRNFLTGIELSQQNPSVKNLLDYAANGASEASERRPEPVGNVGAEVITPNRSEPAQAPQEAPEEQQTAVEEPTVDDIAPEPTPTATESEQPREVPAETHAAPAPEMPLEEATEVVKTYAESPESFATPAQTESFNRFMDPDAPVRYEQNLLPSGAINSSNAPDEDLLAQFKEFVIEEAGLKTKEEQVKVGKLLGWTFGRTYNKAQNIPADELADFLDFYIATGVDNFRAVLNEM